MYSLIQRPVPTVVVAAARSAPTVVAAARPARTVVVAAARSAPTVVAAARPARTVVVYCVNMPYQRQTN